MKMPLGTEVGLGPGHIVIDADPALPKGAQPPQFLTLICCAQRLHGSKCHLVRSQASVQATLF